MELWPTAKYKKEGAKRRVGSPTLDAAIGQAQRVQKKWLPAAQ